MTADIRQRVQPIQCKLSIPNQGTINKIIPFTSLLIPSITAIIAGFAFFLFFI